MATTISKDGTRIAFEKAGSGPPLIIVDGALCYRRSGPSASLAALLVQHFTVFTYDRRGRGDSGDATPYAIEREVEDLAAIVAEAGGWAYVYGVSSGAALALEAAHRGVNIRKLVVYEAPFIVDDGHPPMPEDLLPQMHAAIATGRRGDAVALFLKQVGLPGFALVLMRLLPVWKKLTAVAHTIPYDLTIVGQHQRGKPLAPSQWSGATMPTLAMDGGKSPAWMRRAMRAVADVLPNATYRTLDKQTHMVKAKVHVPVLVEYFNA